MSSLSGLTDVLHITVGSYSTG